MDKKDRIFVGAQELDAIERLCREPDEILASGCLAAAAVVSDISFAKAFLLAANALVDAGNNNHLIYALCTNPILYLYRHAVELFLKALVPKHKRSHDLLGLLEISDLEIREHWQASLAESWVGAIIREFAAMDPGSTSFRYLRDRQGDPIFADDYNINLHRLEERMTKLLLFFDLLEASLRKTRADCGGQGLEDG